MTATYYLVFSVSKLGTRHSGGHATHGAFGARRDAEREARRLATQDADAEYQVCPFAADVREEVAAAVGRMN